MTNTRQRLRVLIETVLGHHYDVAAAIDELIGALDDEIEARVQNRVEDLRQYWTEGGSK